MFWGLSEALDLLNEYLNTFKMEERDKHFLNNQGSSEDSKKMFNKDINILLFGASDPRHIIKTLAKIYTHRCKGMTQTVNFYLVDGCVEIIARNLVLLGIALENSNILSLRTKVHLFMDVYGNSLMRASSHHYLMTKAKSLLKIVTEDDCIKNWTPMLNFSRMKYRELDGLEKSFGFWLSKEKDDFQIQEYWKDRLKQQLGTLFDYREGQFDWDLNMLLKERDGKQICSQEYLYWRETGIAFTFPEYEYSKSNKTLAVDLVRNGDKYIHRGYVGDIQTGPFPAFGLKTTDERMLKSMHGENDYRSTDVTERNLLELFHEITTQTEYEHDSNQSRKYGAFRLKIGKCLTHHDFDAESAEEYDSPWTLINRAKINFLSSDDILSLQEKSSGNWLKFFDIAFVGHNYFKFLQDSFVDILKQKSLFIIETKLLTAARSEEITYFEDKILNYAERNHFKGVVNYRALNSKNAILKFKSSCDVCN